MTGGESAQEKAKALYAKVRSMPHAEDAIALIEFALIREGDDYQPLVLAANALQEARANLLRVRINGNRKHHGEVRIALEDVAKASAVLDNALAERLDAAQSAIRSRRPTPEAPEAAEPGEEEREVIRRGGCLDCYNSPIGICAAHGGRL